MNADQPPWPATLVDGPVKLRPIRRRDASVYQRLRSENHDWLSPWDATSPLGAAQPTPFGRYAATMLRLARQGRQLPWMIEWRGQTVGQLTGNSIERASLQQVTLGYWVARRAAGHGIVPTAVALAFDHCTAVLGLHRVEVAIRPENGNSIRVVEKLGFRCEGLRQAAIHVAGAWRDHVIYALNTEDVPGGLLARWHQTESHPEALPGLPGW